MKRSLVALLLFLSPFGCSNHSLSASTDGLAPDTGASPDVAAPVDGLPGDRVGQGDPDGRPDLAAEAGPPDRGTASGSFVVVAHLEPDGTPNPPYPGASPPREDTFTVLLPTGTIPS